MGSVYIRYHKLNVFFNGGGFNHSPEISLLLTSPTRTKTECLVVKPDHGKTRLGWMAKVGKIWATKPPAHRLDIAQHECISVCIYIIWVVLILEAYFSDVHWLWQDIWSQSHEFVILRCRFLILILTSFSIICCAYFQQSVFGQMEKNSGKNQTKLR